VWFGSGTDPLFIFYICAKYEIHTLLFSKLLFFLAEKSQYALSKLLRMLPVKCLKHCYYLLNKLNCILCIALTDNLVLTNEKFDVTTGFNRLLEADILNMAVKSEFR